jgi:hypothetical protein
MSKTPSFYESSYFFHQRYEDTSLRIFQQQQRKKRDSQIELKRRSFTESSAASGGHVDFGHYGNSGVVAKKKTIQNLKTDTNVVQSTICSIV